MQDTQLIRNNKEYVPYNDFYLRLIACLIAAHMIVVYGEPKSIFELLLIPEYYYACAGSFVIAYLLFSLVRLSFVRLDRKFDWSEQLAIRIALQIFFGLVIPGILAFMLAALYFKVRANVNILHTSYLRYDFQFILLQIVLLNLYYIAYYLYGKWSQAEQIIGKLNRQSIEDKPVQVKDTFQVSKGAKNLMLTTDEIAYFFREAESNFLRTRSGEDFFITQSLDEVQQQLPEDIFFRANRQIILHRQACKGFDLLSYGKLAGRLNPPFNDEVVISQKRAQSFKKWIENN
jgi:hypothetical protein